MNIEVAYYWMNRHTTLFLTYCVVFLLAAVSLVLTIASADRSAVNANQQPVMTKKGKSTVAPSGRTNSMQTNQIAAGYVEPVTAVAPGLAQRQSKRTPLSLPSTTTAAALPTPVPTASTSTAISSTSRQSQAGIRTPRSTPSTTTVLTISALDLGLDKNVNYMQLVCQRYAIKPGRSQIQVEYPAKIDRTGDNPSGSIQTGATNLDKLIRSTSGRKVVLGYSQGAQVVGAWLRRYAYLPDAPSPNELSFLLIGNPERKYGKQPWVKKETPDNTRYMIRDVSRKNDNWSDWHGNVTDSRIKALFGKIHTDYWNVDPYSSSAAIVKVAGNTTYVTVP